MKFDIRHWSQSTSRHHLDLIDQNVVVHSFRANRCKLLLWNLVALGTIGRFGLCLWRPPTSFIFSDPKRHWLNAQRLFRPDLMGASDPILYQIYLYLVQRMTASTPLLISTICGLLSVATAWAFYRAARELKFSPTEALVFYAVITWLPSLTVIFHYFMAETLLLFLVAVGLWMAAQYARKRTLASFLSAVFVWTLACLTKASVVPLAVACLAYLWIIIPPRRISWLAIACGISIALMIPNSIRTYHYLGFVAPFGSAWIPIIQHQSDAQIIRIHWNGGLWQFISPSCYVQPLEPLSPWMIQRSFTNYTIDVYADPQNGEGDWKQERAILVKSGTSQWERRFCENILMLFFAPSWPDSDTVCAEGKLNLWMRWMWGPLFFCVLWGNANKFRQGCIELLPVVTTVFTLFLMFQSSVTMEGRYRKPLEPLLIMNFIQLQSWSARRNKCSMMLC